MFSSPFDCTNHCPILEACSFFFLLFYFNILFSTFDSIEGIIELEVHNRSPLEMRKLAFNYSRPPGAPYDAGELFAECLFGQCFQIKSLMNLWFSSAASNNLRFIAMIKIYPRPHGNSLFRTDIRMILNTEPFLFR